MMHFVLIDFLHLLNPSDNAPRPPDLRSPFRQLHYIVGLLMSTDAPTTPQSYSPTDHANIISASEEVFQYYLRPYRSSLTSADSTSGADIQDIEAAMPAFLNYFFTGPLATTDQTRGRLMNTCTPFSKQIAEAFGVSFDDIAKGIDWITQTLQGKFDAAGDISREEQSARTVLLDEAKAKGWGINHLRREARKRGHVALLQSVFQSMDAIFNLDIGAFRAALGDSAADSFLASFSTARRNRDFQFPTQDNPALTHPLIMTSESAFVVPCAGTLPHLMLKRIESSLSKSDVGDRFLKHRDRLLERETERIFRRIIVHGEFFANVFEAPNATFEHDLIVADGDHLLVVECKASPPKEPLRDPNRAAIRLRRDFQSDRGIQHGYEQADHAISTLRKSGALFLHDADGNIVRQILSDKIKHAHSIVITRDSWGMTAIALPFLKRGGNQSKPWVLNEYDLDAIVDALVRRGWGADRLYDYLKLRVELRSRVIVDDELDIAGYYLKTGSLSLLLEGGDNTRHHLTGMAEIFDQIYRAANAGETVDWEAWEKPPVTLDVRSELRKMLQEGPTQMFKSYPNGRKPGRNEPCPCGSGRKFKRCHGG